MERKKNCMDTFCSRLEWLHTKRSGYVYEWGGVEKRNGISFKSRTENGMRVNYIKTKIDKLQ